MTPALASSNVWGVWRLWHCDAHALGHDRAGGCPGCRPCLNTGQHLPHVSTHWSRVPPCLMPSTLSPPGFHTGHSVGCAPSRQPLSLPTSHLLSPSPHTP